ncbi:hypothetical protein ABJI51_05130 [Amycolatopsis sp. NEAU-NG30]|uniref:Uncharacterized protein n=1 Tax=Amycolatopsis melonis TaxID=3156488 RepID=A0ABV0LAL9_9PSEU
MRRAALALLGLSLLAAACGDDADRPVRQGVVSPVPLTPAVIPSVATTTTTDQRAFAGRKNHGALGGVVDVRVNG